MQDKTSILAATTPQDNSTFHSHLINVRDPETGKRIFNVVNLVEVCKSCLKSSKPWKCSHMSDRISGSKSEAARKQTMLFYRPGQKHVAMRELMGQQASDTSGLIPDEWIKTFHNSTVDIKDRPRAIYLGIDPGGGGPGELGVIGIAETLSPEHGARLAVSAVCVWCYFYFSVLRLLLDFQILHHVGLLSRQRVAVLDALPLPGLAKAVRVEPQRLLGILVHGLLHAGGLCTQIGQPLRVIECSPCVVQCLREALL